MFANLTQKLTHTLRNLSGQGTLNEKNIQDAMRDVRVALLEADVALPVVQTFIATVSDRAMGTEVLKSLKPAEAMVKVVHDELVHTLGGGVDTTLTLSGKSPIIILMAGLQGSGKTTTVAKLAKWLKEEHKKNVAVVSADVYRPAAIDQLQTLAEQVGVTFIPSEPNQAPKDIAKRALSEAQVAYADFLLVDTAGRLHIDDDMMHEIQALHDLLNPAETLFVVDSMTGQDAANTAKVFHDVLPLTGVVLTKTDGASRCGAALSVRHITGKPIKFIGKGEHLDDLDDFDPERVAGQILDMGDIVALVRQVEKHVDKEQTERLAKKLHKGDFDLADFALQLQQMRQMGGMGSIMSKLPGAQGLMQAMPQAMDEKLFARMEVLIGSMTPKERANPDLLRNSGSRKRRIANGAGCDVQDLNQLLKQFKQMQKMMKMMKSGKLQKMMGQFSDKGGFDPNDFKGF